MQLMQMVVILILLHEIQQLEYEIDESLISDDEMHYEVVLGEDLH